MKKRGVFALILVLFIVAGCGKQSIARKPDAQQKSVVPEDSLILLQSGEEQVKPYENFLWAESWSEFGWLCGDGMSLHSCLQDFQASIPQIHWQDDFQILYGDNVSFWYVSVYNKDFEEYCSYEELPILDQLAPGEYYVLFAVRVQGAYITEDKAYETSAYECACRLVIPEK